MGQLYDRIAAVLDEVARTPRLTISRRALEHSKRPESGEPMAGERESALRAGLVLDDALCATYDDIERADVVWDGDNGSYGWITVPDYFDLEEAFVLPAEYGAQGDEATFLEELHLIECRDAAHWTAFRTPGLASAPPERMEIWVRLPASRGTVDLRLDADWGAYLERMLLARGAEQFALTLVPDAAVPTAHRHEFAYFLRRFCAAASHFADETLADLIAETRARATRFSR